jgi:hypothetical protein
VTTDRHSTRNRLTPDDADRIAEAVAAAMRGWYPRGVTQHLTADEYRTLQRIAAHAIGCSTDDLRLSELYAIGAVIDAHDYDAYEPDLLAGEVEHRDTVR